MRYARISVTAFKKQAKLDESAAYALLFHDMGGIGSADPGVRVSAGAGLSAFALSAIVAIFSNVSLGMILLRASASGVAFTLLTYSAFSLIRRFMPELLESGRPPERRSEDSTGTMVNIVLPGGYEPSGEPRDEDEDAEDVVAIAEDDDQAATVDGESAMVSNMSEQDTMDDMGSIENEVQGIRSETLLPEDGQYGRPMGKTARPSVALDELDVLPDLDSLSDSFVLESHEADFGDVPSAEMSSNDGVSGGSDKGDPALMAKAVQTLLRRDQKG